MTIFTSNFSRPCRFSGAFSASGVLLISIAAAACGLGASRETSSSDEAAARDERVTCTNGRDFYASPTGSAAAPGTLDAPLDLATALSATSPAKPCDTIWLRGGVYKGTFATQIGGASGAPIVVRQHAGEKAVIDSAPSMEAAIAVNNDYVWLWGFEITNSDQLRTSAQPVAWPGDLRRGTGVALRGTGVKLIDLVIHDLARGVQVQSEALATEAYGNIIYNNGWDGPDTSNGSAIETQNQSARQLINDNIIFNQYGHGIIALSSESPISNLTIEGNVAFNNGLPGRTGFTRDVLVGGGKPVSNLVLGDNATYGGAQTFVGYGTGCESATIRNNYLVGSTPLVLEKCRARVEHNTLFGQYRFGTLPQNYPTNTYYAARPTGVVMRYRRNHYDPSRTHVVVYNWDKRPEVEVDMTKAGLAPGDQFEVIDPQNYGAALASETVPANAIVRVPAVDLKVAAPIGHAANLAHTSPEFMVLVVQKLKTPTHTLLTR